MACSVKGFNTQLPFFFVSAFTIHFHQMEINLAGQILVLDEAHNIEDCARESASFTLDHNSLVMSREELDGMVINNIRRSKHELLRDFCYSLIKSVI